MKTLPPSFVIYFLLPFHFSCFCNLQLNRFITFAALLYFLFYMWRLESWAVTRLKWFPCCVLISGQCESSQWTLRRLWFHIKMGPSCQKQIPDFLSPKGFFPLGCTSKSHQRMLNVKVVQFWTLNVLNFAKSASLSLVYTKTVNVTFTVLLVLDAVWPTMKTTHGFLQRKQRRRAESQQHTEDKTKFPFYSSRF